MRFLFLQFEPDDGPGRLGAGCRSRGVRCDLVRLYAGERIPSLDQYDALIVLGGAMNAEDDAHFPFLRDAVVALQAAHRRGLLTLGVCLGGQLLARALGAGVTRKAKTEIGYFPIELTVDGEGDPLFAQLPRPVLTLQWHEDAFDLPVGATLLADSPRDSFQAFRCGQSYGIQFHPEPDPGTVRLWAAGSGASLADAADPITADDLVRRGEEIDDQLAEQTAQICRNLVAMAQEARGPR